jgi:hypothetical protein
MFFTPRFGLHVREICTDCKKISCQLPNIPYTPFIIPSPYTLFLLIALRSHALKGFSWWGAVVEQADLLPVLPILGLSKNTVTGTSFFELAISRPAGQTHAVLSIHTSKLVVVEMRKVNSENSDADTDAELNFVGGAETAKGNTGDQPRTFLDRLPQTIVHGYLLLRISNFYKTP